MSTNPEQYRQAWRKFPTGVSVITMRSESGEPYVTTANALLSISLDPMLLLLSVATDGNTCANLLRDGLFAVNFLRSDQSHIADFYARAPSHERSNLPDAHTKHESGIALFDDALVCMVCRCEHEVQAGDHTMFVASVEDIDIREGDALLFYEGQYGSAGKS